MLIQVTVRPINLLTASRRRRLTGQSRPSTGYDPSGHPPPLPAGAYIGPDGAYCDVNGHPIYPPPPGESFYRSMPGSDGAHLPPNLEHPANGGRFEGAGDDPSAPVRNPKAVAARRWKQIEDLQKRIWTQIAKRDIPKVCLALPLSFLDTKLNHLVV